MAGGAAAVSTPSTEPLPSSEPPRPAPSSAGSIFSTTAPASEHPVVLDVHELKTYFFTYDGIVRALDGVTFKVRRGETTGLVGETGCGKSVTAFSITRLIPDPPGRVVSGQVHLGDLDLLFGLDKEARYKRDPKTDRVKIRRSFRRIKEGTERMAAIRGRHVGMIFQEPSQAMNPIFSVSDQIGEALLLHRGVAIIDGMLGATLDDPAVAAAIAELPAVMATGDSTAIRRACAAVGTAANLETLGTEIFQLVGREGVLPEDVVKEVGYLLGRRRLSQGDRRYLSHRRRLMLLQERTNEVSIAEMRRGTALRGPRRAVARRRAAERISHFYYGIWGIRGRSQRPLKNEIFWRVVKLLEGVAIANPVQVARGYPHELSGGMLQRVMIAMALSPEPDVLIADEPTTALDVTIQAQILELMRDLKERVGTGIILITHDLAVIAEVADRVNVMYAGHIVETATVKELFRQPLHPYSQGLLASIPRLDQPEKELASIPGSVPNLLKPPPGCRFHPRCPYAMPVCKESRPPMTQEGPGHTVACYLYKGPVAAE